jgi:cytidyltransferase-like protein
LDAGSTPAVSITLQESKNEEFSFENYQSKCNVFSWSYLWNRDRFDNFLFYYDRNSLERGFMSDKTIMVSGGFDPLHVGHLRMIKEAAAYGKVIVVINSDPWLLRKKGYNFMPWEDRKELIEGYSEVWKVVSVDDSDGTVCEALRREKPDFFANGGDRTSNNTPEKQVCEEIGIEMVWNVGGGKVRSSSELVKEANENRSKN